MVQCFYTLYYLLHGIVNAKTDIITLLKTSKMTFICVMNPDRLHEIETYFKSKDDGVIPSRKKNSRITGTCSNDTTGVNLKFNFASDSQNNSCNDFFRGSGRASEPEVQVIESYLNRSNSTVSSIVILGK